MSNSKLADYTCISPHSNPRGCKIDTITIHHAAGRSSVEGLGATFKTRQASANYGIGTDGRVGLYVPEDRRAWTSSSPANDHRAVTIEVANDSGAPGWHVSDHVLDVLVDLVADICRRNEIERLIWNPDSAARHTHAGGANMTVHSDFVPTLCPGPYLMEKMPEIARRVNNKIRPPEVYLPQRVRVSDASGLVWIYTWRGIENGPYRPCPAGVYTIIELAPYSGNGVYWGTLKSGAGYILVKIVDGKIVPVS